MSDRRNLYTRKVIKDALYELLPKNALAQITVKDICAEADINRATFYRNYKDIFDLYEQLEVEMVQAAFPDGVTENALSQLLNVIYDNQAFYREFFRSRLESPYIKRVTETLGNEALNFTRNRDDYDERTARVLFRYYLHGTLGVLREWVESGCAEPPNVMGEIMAGIARKQLF